MKKHSWFVYPFFLALFFVPKITLGALLYLDPPTASILRGDTVTVSLRLDTDEDECINTIDGVITYDAGIRAIDISRGDSILNLWVEDPKIDDTNRTITFAGGITGGYCGRASGDPSLSNRVIDIVFQSPGFAIGGAEANANPAIKVDQSSNVFLNDGFGTLAQLSVRDAHITLESTAGAERTDGWQDTVREDKTAPSDFAITLTKDETAFGGKYFIVWNTQDKQSGLDHFEVMEEPLEDLYAFRWGRADAPWSIAKSPFVLKDQTLNSTIRVKAIDKAGNETIAVLIPDEALRSLSHNRVLTFVLFASIVFVMVFVGAYILVRRKKTLIASYDSHDET